MSLLYRALWQADAETLIETAHREFHSWVCDKHQRLTVPSEGEFEVPGARVRVVEGSAAKQGDIKRWVLYEDDGSHRWITTMTATRARGEPEGWLWIDLENVSESYLDRVEVAAPRLSRSLLEALPSSHRGPLELRSSESPLGPREMDTFVEKLQHPGRDLPMVVFSPDDRADPEVSIDRAKRAARTLAGLCQVHLLVPQGEEQFRSLLGRELAVWDGACRVYLPGVSLESPDPRRHRYFLARQLGRRPQAAGLRIASFLSPLVTRQRAPRTYIRLRELIDSDLQSTIDELWEEVDRQTEENRRLDENKRSVEGSFLDAATEVEVLNGQLGRVQRDLLRLWTAVDVADVRSEVESAFMKKAPIDAAVVPELPDTCSDAAELAREHLPHLSFPETASRDVDRLDEAIEAPAWAKTAWRGFVALDAYAQNAVAGDGGFYEWCSSSGHPSAWPASSKKLAMVESDSVRQDGRLRQPRELVIDSRVSRSGKIFMEAHLKISEGGGPLAPRIYFYDDTAGRTRKVHIGFFGPHLHMPNKGTN